MKPKYKIFVTLAIFLFVYGLCVKFNIHVNFREINPWVYIIAAVLLLLKTCHKYFIKLYPLVLRVGQYFCEQDGYLISDNLYEPHAQAIDGYTMFLHLKAQNRKVKYVLWKENPLYEKLKRENLLEDIIVLKKSIKKYPQDYIFSVMPYVCSCKYILEASPRMEFNRIYKNNDKIKYIFLQHGMTLLKHGVMQLYNPNMFDQMLISGESEFNVVKKCGFSDVTVIKAGLPRWDFLAKENNPQKTIFVMFTWRNSFGDKRNYTVIDETLYVKRYKSLINNSELRTLLKNNNIKLICSIHHSILCVCEKNIDLGSDIEIADPNRVDEYIKTSDLLITDYSSVAFDFLFLNTPVIFYRLDHDDYTLSDFDTKNALSAKSMDKYLFNCYYNENDTVEKIKYYVENNFELEDEYKNIAESLFYTKTNIRQKIMEEIEKDA